MTSKVFDYIAMEQRRQETTVELIASENFTSEAVCRAVGSCLTNKYSEGYPAHREMGNQGRYYGGCLVVDELETYCIAKWREVFHTDYHVNVQPHSGTSANLAAYMALLQPGDRILSMSLANGGHLSHGLPVNASGRLYDIAAYDVDENGLIDYDGMERLARELKPRLIIAGASAYSRTIDFARFARAAQATGAYFMADIAHIAGLVAAGEHPSPFGLADVVTTTTHKTLRGPRGGLIFCRPELAKRWTAPFSRYAGRPFAARDRRQGGGCGGGADPGVPGVYPPCGGQLQGDGGGVHGHGLQGRYRRHGQPSVLLDLTDTGLTGREVQEELDRCGITLNKNCVPGDKRSPFQTSGVRIGTAAMTTKGYTAEDFCRTARRIDEVIRRMTAEKAAQA